MKGFFSQDVWDNTRVWFSGNFFVFLLAGFQYPKEGLNPRPLQWKCGLLITEVLNLNQGSSYMWLFFPKIF